MEYSELPRERRDLILAAAKRAMKEISEDVEAGTVPVTAGFSWLHEFVDANEYGGLTTDFADLTHEEAGFVQDRVDFRLKLIASRARRAGQLVYPA